MNHSNHERAKRRLGGCAKPELQPHGAEVGLVNAASGCVSLQFRSTVLIRSVLSGLEINVKRHYGAAATTSSTHITAGVSSAVKHNRSQGTGLQMYTPLNQHVVPLQHSSLHLRSR